MIVCCFPWWNLGGLKFKRVLFISGVLASSLPWRAGKCPESDRRAGPWMPKVGRLKDTAEKLFRSLIFWCWSTFSFVTVASLECDELPKIVWPESTFLFETIVKTDDEMGSFAGKLGRHFSVTFSGLFKYAEKLFEPWATFTLGWQKFLMKNSGYCSHLNLPIWRICSQVDPVHHSFDSLNKRKNFDPDLVLALTQSSAYFADRMNKSEESCES